MKVLHTTLRIMAFLILGLLLRPAAAETAENTVGEKTRSQSSPGLPFRSSPKASPSIDTAAPAVTFAEANPENRPLAFSGSGRPKPERRDYAGPSIFPGLLAVAVVCGVFLVILYAVKKYVPGHRQMFSHPAMEVLGRTHLDPRRYVSLLRVGKRIVVVGVSPDEMRALSEITDEEEITGILEVARPKTEAGISVFGRLFHRTVQRNEEEETRAMARVKAEEIDRQLASLRGRVQEFKTGERGDESRAARRVDAVG